MRTPRSLRASLAPGATIIALVAASGCSSAVPVGTDCDPDAAREVAYRAGDGQPAYAGQAYVIGTCATCHAEGSANRQGAPAGRIYGLTLVTGTGATRTAELERLLREQAGTYRDRDEVYGAVVHGSMPPSGWPTNPGYGLASGEPLPDIRSDQAHEILRNWLACGAPVVESTTSEPIACSADTDCVVTSECSADLGACVGVGDVVPAAP